MWGNGSASVNFSHCWNIQTKGTRKGPPICHHPSPASTIANVFTCRDRGGWEMAGRPLVGVLPPHILEFRAKSRKGSHYNISLRETPLEPVSCTMLYIASSLFPGKAAMLKQATIPMNAEG